MRNDKISITFVEASILKPMVTKGTICSQINVYPAECRGRRCSYRGKLVVRLARRRTAGGLRDEACPLRPCALSSSQADVSWSLNGVPKGIIKQSLGHLPIMVKSQLCNLHGLSPRQLVEHHEEAEVSAFASLKFNKNNNGSLFLLAGNGWLLHRERH